MFYAPLPTAAEKTSVTMSSTVVVAAVAIVVVAVMIVTRRMRLATEATNTEPADEEVCALDTLTHGHPANGVGYNPVFVPGATV
jgi:beta-lactamase regulating signal transducer with metallopeptidase domain